MILGAELKTHLISPLAAALGSRLRMVAVHGSAMPFLEDPDPPLIADLNVLAVLDRVDLGALDRVRKVATRRDNEGVRLSVAGADELPVLLATFPAEALDLMEDYKVVHGEDLLAGLAPDPAGLAAQLRAELLAKRQRLRGVLAVAGPTEAEVGVEVLQMQAAFTGFARRILALSGRPLPPRRLEAVLAALAAATGLGAAPLEAVRDLQATREAGRRRPAGHEKRMILEQFLIAWDALLALLAAPPEAPAPPPDPEAPGPAGFTLG